MELEPNRKLFGDHSPSILHGALLGASSLWPWFSGLGLELLGDGGGGMGMVGHSVAQTTL